MAGWHAKKSTPATQTIVQRCKTAIEMGEETRKRENQTGTDEEQESNARTRAREAMAKKKAKRDIAC